MMRKKFPLLLFTLCILGIIQPAVFAADYYVDNSCGDNGNGTTQTCGAPNGPFNSLANAQFGLTGDQSGNRLLFKKDQTFRGQYTVNAYGSSGIGNSFTISSYGSGADPIISGGIRNMAINCPSCAYIVVDGLVFTTSSSSQNIHIGSNAHHVTVKKCELEYAWAEAIRIEDSSNNTIDSNIVHDNSQSGGWGSPTHNGIMLYGPSTMTGTVISNNTIYNIDNYGICPVGYGNSNRLGRVDIYANTCYNNSSGIYLVHSDNDKVYNNHLYSNRGPDEEYGIGILSSSNCEFYNNDIHDNYNYGVQFYGDSTAQWGRASNNYFHHNILYNHTEGMAGHGRALATGTNTDYVGNNNVFAYNIMWNNNYGFLVDEVGGSGNQFINNVIYDSNNAGVASDHNNPGWIFKNNIIVETGAHCLSLSNVSTGFTHENNLYYRTDAGNPVMFNGRTYSCANIANFEATGICSDPKFVEVSPDSWDDFRLDYDSPSIDTGQNLGSSYDDALDPNDTIWPPSTLLQGGYGSGWEIGAFIYNHREGAVPVAPSNLTLVSP